MIYSLCRLQKKIYILCSGYRKICSTVNIEFMHSLIVSWCEQAILTLISFSEGFLLHYLVNELHLYKPQLLFFKAQLIVCMKSTLITRQWLYFIAYAAVTFNLFSHLKLLFGYSFIYFILRTEFLTLLAPDRCYAAGLYRWPLF